MVTTLPSRERLDALRECRMTDVEMHRKTDGKMQDEQMVKCRKKLMTSPCGRRHQHTLAALGSLRGQGTLVKWEKVGVSHALVMDRRVMFGEVVGEIVGAAFQIGRAHV